MDRPASGLLNRPHPRLTPARQADGNGHSARSRHRAVISSALPRHPAHSSRDATTRLPRATGLWPAHVSHAQHRAGSPVAGDREPELATLPDNRGRAFGAAGRGTAGRHPLPSRSDAPLPALSIRCVPSAGSARASRTVSVRWTAHRSAPCSSQGLCARYRADRVERSWWQNRAAPGLASNDICESVRGSRFILVIGRRSCAWCHAGCGRTACGGRALLASFRRSPSRLRRLGLR